MIIEAQPPLPYGCVWDLDRLELHRRALQLMQPTRGVDYFAAVLMAEALGTETAVFLRAEGGNTVLQLKAPMVMGRAAFTGVAYSGGPVTMAGDDFAIDLDGIQLPMSGRVSILRNHDPAQIAGHAAASVAGGMLHISGSFSAVTAAGREASALHAEGHPFGLSVGVSGRMERMRGSITVNGRVQRLAAVMRSPRLHEVSLVHSGADPHARLLPA